LAAFRLPPPYEDADSWEKTLAARRGLRPVQKYRGVQSLHGMAERMQTTTDYILIFAKSDPSMQQIAHFGSPFAHYTML